MSEKVVFLAFSNTEKLTSESLVALACKGCRNKTFSLIYDQPETFPMLRCSCCGIHLGRMGWADEDKENLK